MIKAEKERIRRSWELEKELKTTGVRLLIINYPSRLCSYKRKLHTSPLSAFATPSRSSATARARHGFNSGSSSVDFPYRVAFFSTGVSPNRTPEFPFPPILAVSKRSLLCIGPLLRPAQAAWLRKTLHNNLHDFKAQQIPRLFAKRRVILVERPNSYSPRPVSTK